MKLGTLARHAAFWSALALLGAGATLYALERSGWLRERVRAELRARLGEDVELDAAQLHWFVPSLSLVGLRAGGDDPAFAFEQVELAFALRDGALAPRRVDVTRGRVELSDELVQRVQKLASRGAAAPGSGAPPARPTRVPTIVVRAVDLEWLHPQWGASPIGRVDALVREEQGGVPQIAGRVAPAFAAPEHGPAPQIVLAGSRDPDGRISLRASCSGLPISAAALPRAPQLEFVRPWNPRADLSFALEASFRLDASAPPSGRLRATLTGGSLHPPTSPSPVTEVEIDLDAQCDAVSLAGLLDPHAWRSTAHLSASWNELPVEAWALVGTNAGAGSSARAWLHAPHLPLSQAALDATGLGAELATSWKALSPRGAVDVVCGFRWPLAASLADEQAALSPEISVDVRCDGRAGVTYFGWPRSSDGRIEGLPLPVEALTGRVLALHDPRRTRATVIALLELLAHPAGSTHEEQPVFGEGLVIAPASGARHPSFDLRFGAHGLVVDERLRSALEGLYGTQFVWPGFAPAGGSVSARARLYKDDSLLVPATHVALELTGVGARWSELPLDLDGLSGTLEIVGDPRRLVGVGFELAARTPQGAAVAIRGRVQDDPSSEAAGRESYDKRIESFAVDIDDIALRGADRDALVSALGGVGAALDLLMPQGRIDLDYRAANARAGAPREWRVEARPRQAQLTPSSFRVLARNVRGRVVVEGQDPLRRIAGVPHVPNVRTRILPLVGDWPGDARIGANADFRPDSDGQIELYGTGIDLSNKGLIGAFRESQAQGVGGGHEGLGLGALNVDGLVDFRGELVLPQFVPQRPTSVYRVHLRDNDVQTSAGESRFALDHLAGILEQRSDELFGERITATLAGSPIVLRDARFRESAGEYLLTTRLDALELPLDREHLRPFLDEHAVDALLGDLAWRGEIDVENAELTLSGAANAGGEVRFTGDLRPRAMSIDFGAPITVDSARVHVEELVYGHDSVRASASVEDFDGSISDRRLTDASLRLVYADLRLSVRELDGKLENGALRNIGGAIDGAPPAFAIELAPPYRFELALDVDDATVAGMLRGLFESEFATRGVLRAELALAGDLERVTGIHGTGTLELRATNLWSIPVVRDLFSQLGFDSTAVFERVKSAFDIEGGVVRMHELRVSSPLLELVGAGTLDFDGALAYDLEVRYGLVDKLGPLTRLVYWIQNNLLRVAIRGDMARPRVEFKGALSGLRGERRIGRQLPLPGFAPLPARF